MTVFDDREKAFEAKFRLDQDMDFKARMRRDKLLGLWAAEKMGLTGADAQAYAKTVIEAEFDGADHDVGHKVVNDLSRRGIVMSLAEIHHQMTLFLEIAREQILAEMSR